MCSVIKSSFKSGSVTVPKSKSEIIRALFAAMVSDRPTLLYITESDLCEDVETAINFALQMGCEIIRKQGGIKLFPMRAINPNPHIDCKDSAALLRFSVPFTAVLSRRGSFCGSLKLGGRPLKELVDCLKEHGIDFSCDKLPFEMKGVLQSGVFEIDASVSSQYISGLMFALPLCADTSRVILKGERVSAGYLDMTIYMLSRFGISIKIDDNGYIIEGCQTYKTPEKLYIGGDWSAGANFIVLGALCGEVKLSSLEKNSLQPDSKIAEILSEMGADISFNGDLVTVKKAARLKAVERDMSGCPDIVPILGVAAAFAEGVTVLKNVGRLKSKESDRLNSTVEMLAAFSIKAYVKDNDLYIEGGKPIYIKSIRTYADHRIAMAASVLAAASGSDVSVDDCRCVEKSYKNFFKELKKLGGELYEI